MAQKPKTSFQHRGVWPGECRQDCLRDQPALFGAGPYARSNASAALGAFMEAYPADKLLDTGEERLWNGPFFAPAAGTLDGWLLDHWYTGTAQYDALFMQNFSSASEVHLYTHVSV